MSVVSARIRAVDAAFAAVKDFYLTSRYGKRRGDPGICDLTFGNPHEMPLNGLVTTLRERAVPNDKNWFAYKTSEEEPQAFLAQRLRRELALPFEPPDIALTTGAFAAIMVAFRLVLDAGDKAVISEPAWFCYEPMLLAADAVPRKVKLKVPTFDLDLSAIEAAIGPKTRLVIVNTPHNPTGRIYDDNTLKALAELLERASARYGHRVFLLSDEPYRRLRFDGRGFTSPASFYPWTLISYSYGKILLAPGQRIGYLAISPSMPSEERKALRDVMFSTQMALGWCFPNAIMQYAVPDLENLSIDLTALARRRDLLAATLTKAGYEVLLPEGTFYLWTKWPKGDAEYHWNRLADRDVFVLPGSIMNATNYFRISLTASDSMVERALAAFREEPRCGG
ncbi:MAG TPA: aminotransferase class I/II-fold pyridoxal phosphate-dependent enzyme [Candidatus Limnocylindrales bacterium]|nr:aminotransferase class I/II-fold pyridoxal phosphate-dependent enzyme [Candidatus Limnocylindrales bacterium]